MACAAVALVFCLPLNAQRQVAPIQRERDKLTYTVQENGDRIPDYSYAGYELSEKEIPTVANKIVVRHTEGDATALIQSAIDYVSGLKPGADGFRGAVLLDKGTFEVAGELYIRTSGVVLRGSGFDPNGGTTLQATGKARETVINVRGRNDLIPGDTLRITDKYVPLNAQSLTVSSASGLKAGDRIMIRRAGNPEWIAKLGSGGQRPGNLDLHFDRTITAVNGNTITFDVPLTSSIAAEEGGGTVIPYTWPGRISQVGVEFLIVRSNFERLPNLKDEEHAWYGVSMQDVENAWVRQMRFYHLAGSAVVLGERSSKITVEDIIAREFVSEIANGRRNMFYTMGQQTLFQRIHTELGHHDFLVGALATGPNVFIQCKSESPTSFSGAMGNWSVGSLFDIVYINGNALGFQNREGDGNRAGWTGANSMLWNCQASIVLIYQPPTAANWAFGCWGQFKGGRVYDENAHISPRSLFYAQLGQRLGRDVSQAARMMPQAGESSTSPSMELARKLTLEAMTPPPSLYEWIKKAEMPEAALSVAGVPDQSVLPAVKMEPVGPEMKIENGWLTWNGTVLTGRTQGVRWWNGSDNTTGAAQGGAHITRYVPARIGEGLTDDLDEMTDNMVTRNIAVTDHNYGLWYDRRRDDHQRIRRMDGEVWPPFYELPFARSGEKRAWDGLSLYDLTRYNNWYFGRLAEYTRLGNRKGLALINQHYFQHNILEAGAHYADFPWRPINNINKTGVAMVEPVNYAGDKRIFYDEQFYNVSDPGYAELHKKYIRKNLDNFPEGSGVIHSTSAEYTGPFHFVKFWLETIGEWERETGKNALVALSATKDVQDQVLADPALASVVDIIDIRYWSEGEDGVNAPPGGVHLAPRQHVRINSGGKSGPVTFGSVYRAVRRYREQNPGKAVIYNAANYPQMAWAVFMAGGSLAGIPRVGDAGFTKAAAQMQPMDAQGNYYLLGSGSGHFIVYSSEASEITVPATRSRYEVLSVNPRTGKIDSHTTVRSKGGSITVPVQAETVLWIK